LREFITAKKKIDLINLILGLIGGVMLIISGSLIFIASEQFRMNLEGFGYSLEDAHIDPVLFMTPILLTLMWGILSILLSLIGYFLKRVEKRSFRLFYWLLLGVGIIAMVGNFIIIKPLEYVDLGGHIMLWVPLIKLSGTLFFIDPVLVTIAGVFGLIVKS